MKERLQKLLSARGVCSRRASEALIQAGRVTVNGEAATLGAKADPETDTVLVDGKPLPGAQEYVYLMLNKPRGYVTTLSDERGRRDVSELVRDCPARVYPVGRLDLDSEGLLLLTNDGALAQALTHPSHRVEKEYLVRVSGEAASALPVLRQGMTVEGVHYQGAAVRELPSGEADTALLSITITEGKNRQVRNMCAYAGLRVLRLKRIREGTLTLGGLPKGKWRRLTREEAEALKREAAPGRRT